jgi:hypothetical protein
MMHEMQSKGNREIHITPSTFIAIQERSSLLNLRMSILVSLSPSHCRQGMEAKNR